VTVTAERCATQSSLLHSFPQHTDPGDSSSLAARIPALAASPTHQYCCRYRAL